MALDNIHNTLSTSLMTNQNMNTNKLSDSISIQGIPCYAVQAVWTGFNSDTTARIITSGSNDGSNFTPVDTIIPTGTTGNYLLNVEKAGYRFVQVAYTQTTGVGTLNLTISGKVI